MDKGTGTVKWFNADKGYGFITAETPKGGEDVFLHIKNLRKSEVEPKSIEKGDRLGYEIEQGPRGPVAVNISRSK